MNQTNFEHALWALGIQVTLALLTGDWWLGAAVGIAVFVGREHSQAEERYIKANGGERYGTPIRAEFGAFLPRYWDVDSVLDVAVPAAACVALAAVMGHVWIPGGLCSP
jgi:hypothetical protein